VLRIPAFVPVPAAAAAAAAVAVVFLNSELLCYETPGNAINN
jgi:hypothetical protein